MELLNLFCSGGKIGLARIFYLPSPNREHRCRIPDRVAIGGKRSSIEDNRMHKESKIRKEQKSCHSARRGISNLSVGSSNKLPFFSFLFC